MINLGKKNIYKVLLICILQVFFAISSYCQYKIEGFVDLDEKWQNRIFFSAIDEWNDLLAMSESMVLKEAKIDNNGYFSFIGDELPSTYGIFRLHMIPCSNPVATIISDSENSNYINFILSNNDSIFIYGEQSKTPLGKYRIESNLYENKDFFELSKNIKKIRANIDTTKSEKLKFLYEQKLEKSLSDYIDLSTNPLGNLLAIQSADIPIELEKNWVDKTIKGLENPKISPKYLASLNRHYASINSNEASSIAKYTKAFLWMSLAANLLLSFFLLKLLSVNRKIKNESKHKVAPENDYSSRKNLTKKEQEVLELIIAGKTNQEIANKLFVELSTIKTHVNNLYRKTGISNRKQLVELFKTNI